MKTRTATTLPALTLPRLSSKLEGLADNLARFAIDFGLKINDDFPSRLATIGFVNAVLLGLQDAKAADELDELLAADDILSTAELQGALPTFTKDFSGQGSWTADVHRFLLQQWRLSSDNHPGLKPLLELQLRILHGIRFGLALGPECQETAQKVAELSQTLWVENQFLSRRLIAWARQGWKPSSPAFNEFTASFYNPGSLERAFLTEAVAAVLPAALHLNQPWELSFWTETGWNCGRRFAQSHLKDCKALLEETGPENVKACHDLYQAHVLGTARSDGELQIERATLSYFAAFNDGSYARVYCSGREPRRVARIAFDFTFWMAIFSVFPMPTISSP